MKSWLVPLNCYKNKWDNIFITVVSIGLSADNVILLANKK